MASFGGLGILGGTSNESSNFTATEVQTGTGYDYYAMVMGLVSFIASVATGILLKFLPQIEDKMMLVFAGVTGLLWGIALIVLTFIDPFTTLSNGYLSVWACAIFSCLLLFEVSTKVKTAFLKLQDIVGEGTISALILNILFGMVEMAAAVIICYVSCTDIVRYATAVGVIGTIAPILLFVPKIPAKIKAGVAVFNILWWTLAILILTFFTQTFGPLTFANGYFGTWGALIFAVSGSLPFVAALNIEALNALTGADKKKGEE